MSKAFEVTDSSFESDVVGAVTPVVVDFWAVWCGPCRMVAPIVDELAKYDKVGFAKLNVDENPDSMKYGIRIPTLLVFKDGKPVDQIVGALPTEARGGGHRLATPRGRGWVPVGFAGFKPVGGRPSASAVGSTPTLSRHARLGAPLSIIKGRR